MTSTLAPGLLLGSAPPANAPPGVPGTKGDSPRETFAALLQTATSTATGDTDGRGGGEPAALPPGGAPSMPEGADSVTELLARLMAIAQGLQDAGGPTDATESTDVDLLLDRLAEAGGLEAPADGATAIDVLDVLGAIDAIEGLDAAGAMGAVEALMAYLVMGQSKPIDPDAVSALPDDVLALLQRIEGTVEGVATDLELAAHRAVEAAVELTQPAPVGDSVSDALVEVSGEPVTLSGVVPVLAEEAPVASESGVGAVATSAASEQASEGLDPVVAEDVRGGQAVRDASRAASELSDASMRPAASTAGGASGAETVVVASSSSSPVVADAPSVETVATPRVVTASTVAAEVADTVRVAAFRGDSEVRLLLNPPELGQLDIHISRGEHGLRIVMEASQAGARELLDRSVTGLHQALEARDLRVDRLEVRATDTGRGSLDTSAGGQQSGGGASSGSQGEGAPEWSPVAMFESVSNPAGSAAGDGQSQQTTDGDSSTLSGAVSGSVDVLA